MPEQSSVKNLSVKRAIKDLPKLGFPKVKPKTTKQAFVLK